MLDEFGNELDAGYPIRVFDDSIEYSDWMKEIGDGPYDNRHYNMYKQLKTPEGAKKFDDFLKILNSAPDLTNLSPEADEDVKDLFRRDWYECALQDIEDLSYRKDLPQQAEAVKILQRLSDKGYPKAQSAYAHYLSEIEGKNNQALGVLTHLESNPYANEAEQEHASDKKRELKATQKNTNLTNILLKQSQEGAKKESFMDKATKAEDLQDVAEENLETKMNQVNRSVLANFADRPYSEWKKEEIQALETFSNKGYSRAQEFLMWYYEDRGQYTLAYKTAEKMRRNPFANEAFSQTGAEHAKKMAPLARKEQALKPGGRK